MKFAATRYPLIVAMESPTKTAPAIELCTLNSMYEAVTVSAVPINK